MSDFAMFKAGWEASREGFNHEVNDLLKDGHETRGKERQLEHELRRMFEQICIRPEYRYDPPRNGEPGP